MSSEARAKELVRIYFLPRGGGEPFYSWAMPRYIAESVVVNVVSVEQKWEGRSIRAASIVPLGLVAGERS